MMIHRHLKNVSTLSLLSGQCVGCGLCADVCPHRCFSIADGKAVIVNDVCMECGACALNCPAGAISVNPGVGCAAAFIKGWLTGSEPSCDCSGGDCC